MWKSLIITTALLAFGASTIHAAGLESGQRITLRDRSERNTILEHRISYNEMITGLSISDDINAGFVFGLDKEKQDSHEGPTDKSKGFGIGLGLSFSF
ncbi:hypothetical protein [Maridesulfovibrio hydrothermalis]|uniref:Outer membrane protein beta-barrel domain-containing protein n=1 Tax=Maridesulfovibrio hydrothermalis AM13 = DSM 14728 TaxID=1121451 RepID=L0RDS5_9BACT|nr:hypothetical protein [Maridesulfovibrio hydrothermalis]CCO24372.1 conserved exported protein of unknown function [Maridesulfovibrio hydrothermalis AM13 = DSM 14728]